MAADIGSVTGTGLGADLGSSAGTGLAGVAAVAGVVAAAGRRAWTVDGGPPCLPRCNVKPTNQLRGIL